MPELNQVDVALRQAIYFEYLKEGQADKEDHRVRDVLLVLLALIIDSGIDFTVTVSKSKLDGLIATINDKLGAEVVAHNQQLVKDVFDMMTSSVDVGVQNYAKVAEVNGVLEPAIARFVKAENKFATVDKLYSGSTVSNNKLWRAYVKQVTPGTGIEPLTMVKDLGRSIINQATRLVKQAYIEKLPAAEILKRIKGDPKQGFKDGMINKIGNQAKTVARTLGSSATNYINNAIGQLFYNQYQWISTIDSVTTTICRSRHLKIYTYGEGPVPPAHFNCRSIIVGIDGSVANNVGSTYFDWLQSQPESVLADVLTPEEAAAIKSGKADRKAYTAFKNDKRLTPEQFKGKTNRMQSPSNDN